MHGCAALQQRPRHRTSAFTSSGHAVAEALAEFAVGCVFCSPECRYGHYLAAACTASSDATCRTCHPCPAGTWQTAACDAGGVGWAAAGERMFVVWWGGAWGGLDTGIDS